MEFTTKAAAFDFAEFFKLRTQAFVEKDFVIAADALSLPTSVYFIGQRLAICSLRDAIDAMRIYRTNLSASADYADTRTVVLGTQVLPNDMVKVHIRSSHFTPQRQDFATVDAHYFMREDPDGKSGWRIELIEALGREDKRMTKNLGFI